MAYLWGQLISMDGNTVECCENKGVKDQNGNDLRLCSAIDKERVQADEEKAAKNALAITLVGCQGSLSKAYQFQEYNTSCHLIGDPSLGNRRCECFKADVLATAPKYLKLNLVDFCTGDDAHGGTHLGGGNVSSSYGSGNIGNSNTNNGALCGGQYTMRGSDLHCRTQSNYYNTPTDNQIKAISKATGHQYRLKYIEEPVTRTVIVGIGTGNGDHNRKCQTVEKTELNGYYILERVD